MDMIYHLSTNPDATVKGWCYMSRVQMAEELDVTKQTVLNLISKLVQKGFIDKDEITTFLKTTPKWNEVYFTNGKKSLPSIIQDGKESLPDDGKKSLPKGGKKSLPYNNTLYNDNIDNTASTEKKVSVYALCMKIYYDFILDKVGVEPDINSTTGISLNKIISYLKKNVKDKEDENAVPDSLKVVFDNYDLWDVFHQKNLKLNQIESNFINILNAIRNGKKHTVINSNHSREQRQNGVDNLVQAANNVLSL